MASYTSPSPIDNADLNTNMETKVLSILSDKYPSLDCGPGTPVYEMVVRPIAFLWTQQANGLAEIIDALSFTNYNTMNSSDMDRLMNRYFLTRRSGVNTIGTVRCIIDTISRQKVEEEETSCEKDIAIYAGEIWETDDGRTYEVESNKIIKADNWEELDETGTYLHKYLDDAGENWIYYIDVAVTSTGTGNIYNAAQNDKLTPTGASAPNISAAYFLAATNDGGEEETNYDFYQRAKDTLATKGLLSYKTTAAILQENFTNLKQVISIGLKDSEMIRDLAVINTLKNPLTIGTEIKNIIKTIYDVDLPTDAVKLTELGNKAESSAVASNTLHLGGKCDIYIQPSMYYTEAGYTAPLGFPIEYQTLSLKNNAIQLRDIWNSSITSFGLVDKGLRGSIYEQIPGLEDTIITNLRSNIEEVDNFVNTSDNTSLHTDNIVKQMWPIVVTGTITIESNSPDSDKALAKTTLTTYINSLKSSEAPQVGELAHVLRAVGIKEVHVPMELWAYYLTDELHMEYIGLNKQKSSTSLLQPIEDDSLLFTIPENNTSQISVRTCTWYTNPDLFTITIAGEED